MSIILSSTAISSKKEPVSGVSEFTLSTSNQNGFLRGMYGAIMPDNSYDGKLLERLTVHYSSSLSQWYYILILEGLWAKGDLITLDMDGAFDGVDVGTLTGNGADDFFDEGGNTYWRWNYFGESFFIAGNLYDCVIVWNKTI